jgi:hypothetical protein
MALWRLSAEATCEFALGLWIPGLDVGTEITGMNPTNWTLNLLSFLSRRDQTWVCICLVLSLLKKLLKKEPENRANMDFSSWSFWRL